MAENKRYDICVPKPGSQGKTFWHKVGAAFAKDDGSLSIKLDSVPVGAVQDPKGNTVAWDGWLKCFPQDSSRSSAPASGGGGGKAPVKKGDLDDEIPF